MSEKEAVHIKRYYFTKKKKLIFIIAIVVIAAFVLTGFCRINNKIFCKLSLNVAVEDATEEESEKLNSFHLVRNMELSNCEIKDISFLKDMPFLNELKIITTTDINDWSAFKSCSSLKYLNVEGGTFEDLTCFSEMNRLENLYLFSMDAEHKVKIKSTKGIEDLSLSLKNFYTTNIENTDSIHLERFEKLEGFGVVKSSVKEIYFNNPKIHAINVAENPELKSLSISDACVNIGLLNISDSNNLKINIKELLKLNSLKVLYISEGQFNEDEIKVLRDKGVRVDVSD